LLALATVLSIAVVSMAISAFTTTRPGTLRVLVLLHQPQDHSWRSSYRCPSGELQLQDATVRELTDVLFRERSGGTYCWWHSGELPGSLLSLHILRCGVFQ
jgi:hypothetical protein